MTGLWRRLRRLNRVELDRILAAVLLVGAEIEVISVNPSDAPLALCMVVAAGYSLPLAMRRTRPLTTAAICVASVLTMRALLTDPTDFFIPFLTAMLISYSVGAYAEGPAAVFGIAFIVPGVLLVSILQDDAVVGDYIFPCAFAAVVWTAGRAVRVRSRLTEELHEAAVREQEEHERQAVAAAAEERRRIAREMHDVVAHSVSVMVVQAGGARRILARDPARAVAAAEQIERTGRDALAEMRRLLGVLHHDGDEHLVRAPQPSMTAVGRLIEGATAAGLPVVLVEEGEPRPLPAGLDLAAFRVVQEGLTNALKYADGSDTEVRVRWRERSLELEVLDRGPGPARERIEPSPDGGGHGLVGMQERVRIYGGSLEAGRRRGGGFRIRAKLPLVADDEQVEAVA
jgi:signal transduction histidine kinase